MPDPLLIDLNLLSHVADDFSTELSQFHVFLQGFQPLISPLQKALTCGKNRLSRLGGKGLENADPQKI